MSKDHKEFTQEEIDIYNIPIEDFFHYALSIDCVLFGFDNEGLKVLLIQRKFHPLKGVWALPGDLVKPNKNFDDSAVDILNRMTGVDGVFLKQVQAFGEVERNPIGRVVTIAYYALVDINLVDINEVPVKPELWATDAQWSKISELPEIGFDHKDIISTCLKHLIRDAKLSPIGFELLPEKFTLAQFQELYEAIYQTKLDKSNFRKKVKSLNILETLNELEKNVSHRPAKLYKFDKKRYHELEKSGFLFDVGV